MQLVLNTYGLLLRKFKNGFQIVGKDRKRRISPHRVSTILISHPCQITSDAIVLASEYQIPLFIVAKDGTVAVRTQSRYFTHSAEIRRKQVLMASHTGGTQWIINLLTLKTEYQITNLKYLANRKYAMKERIHQTIERMTAIMESLGELKSKLPKECRNQLMGKEGNISRYYWQCLSVCMPVDFQFAKRSRRPAQDSFNALLNYTYGMLYNVIEGGVFAAGLDVHFGILHADQLNNPTFVYDMIEPFRPWLDRMLIEQCLEGKVKSSFFEAKNQGIYLNTEGRNYLIPTFNEYIKDTTKLLNQKKLSIHNHIHRYAGEFAKQLMDWTP